MASYFDEHADNAQTAEEQQLHDLLTLARILLEGGSSGEWDREFQRLSEDRSTPPPASKTAVDALPRKILRDCSDKHQRCPICIVPYEPDDTTITLPCKHAFHSDCILPWLKKTNSCPVCRYELPTDDADYEEYKKFKARTKQREFELQSLHDSMFG